MTKQSFETIAAIFVVCTKLIMPAEIFTPTPAPAPGGRRLLTCIINNQSATCSVRGRRSGVIFPGVLRDTVSCGGELLPSHKTNIVIGVKICSEEFGLLFIN